MNKRNYSLDLLRLLAMFMIVILHTLGHGGLLYSTVPYSSTYYAAWFIESLALCAVNCYGILSGYTGVDGHYRYSNIITLWLQVLLYSVGITFLLAGIGKLELTPDIIKIACFPVMHGEYWYFTAYVGLFFMIPIINNALNAMKQHQVKALYVTCIIFYCLFPTYFRTDPFVFSGGYNFVWLVILYIIGACIKKGKLFSSIPFWICALGYLFTASSAWIFKFQVEKTFYKHKYKL